MILTKQAILDRIKTGHIVFDGDLDQVQENSINIRLGRDLWSCDRVVGTTDLSKPRTFSPINVEVHEGKEFFRLKPHSMHIGTTQEVIGTHLTGDGIAYVPEMRARSTTGRHGLTVALCAGVGDVGYAGRWALEIVNNNRVSVLVPVGTEVGQVVFYEATAAYPKDGYGGDTRYQKLDGSIQFLPKPFDIPK